jgi:hypothetical protein
MSNRFPILRETLWHRQASAAIIEAAVLASDASDASKKIYPRRVGKGNSAPLWVVSLVPLKQANEFNGSEVGFQGCVGNLDPGLGKLNLRNLVDMFLSLRLQP